MKGERAADSTAPFKLVRRCYSFHSLQGALTMCSGVLFCWRQSPQRRIWARLMKISNSSLALLKSHLSCRHSAWFNTLRLHPISIPWLLPLGLNRGLNRGMHLCQQFQVYQRVERHHRQRSRSLSATKDQLGHYCSEDSPSADIDLRKKTQKEHILGTMQMPSRGLKWLEYMADMLCSLTGNRGI